MQLGMDGGVFYRTQFLKNETRNEFCKSREIKKSFHPEVHIYIFQAPKASWTCEFSSLSGEHRMETPTVTANLIDDD